MTSVPNLKAGDFPVETTAKVLPWVSWICLVLAGLIVLHPLSYTWSALQTYSFGWWVPLLAVILFSERWSARPGPESIILPSHPGRKVLAWGVLFLFFRMALESSFVSRPLLTACALIYVAALLYWLWIYGGTNWVRHFAFPVCFLLLCVPWPTQIELPLVQGLERFNAWVVAQVLVIGFFIPAQASGNVIALPHSVLDVEEACSGVRSLQAAIMIGFLLGELYRFFWPLRIRLVLLAALFALFGNFLRTLFLGLLTYYKGVSVMAEWHDSAGAFILIFTSASIWLICHFLHRRQPRPVPSSGETARLVPPLRQVRLAQQFALGILIAAVVVESATQGWYAWRGLSVASCPTWTALAPTPGHHEVEIPDETSRMLHYDAGREVEWTSTEGWAWTAYWFRYHPNPWGAAIFQTHNPDKCLPAVGYTKIANEEPFDARVGDIQVRVWPELYTMNGIQIYVFWLVYGNQSNFPIEQAVLSSTEGYGAKLSAYLTNIWLGRRGSKSEMESLETIIAGPTDYAAVKAAYLQELPKMVVPDPVPPSSPTQTAGGA